jgi:hypothetical protein
MSSNKKATFTGGFQKNREKFEKKLA